MIFKDVNILFGLTGAFCAFPKIIENINNFVKERC